MIQGVVNFYLEDDKLMELECNVCSTLYELSTSELYEISIAGRVLCPNCIESIEDNSNIGILWLSYIDIE
jgi:hypothetical protein